MRTIRNDIKRREKRKRKKIPKKKLEINGLYKIHLLSSSPIVVKIMDGWTNKNHQSNLNCEYEYIHYKVQVILGQETYFGAGKTYNMNLYNMWINYTMIESIEKL